MYLSCIKTKITNKYEHKLILPDLGIALILNYSYKHWYIFRLIKNGIGKKDKR